MSSSSHAIAIKQVEILWNLENQLVTHLPTLSSVTKSNLLLQFQNKQRVVAKNNLDRLEEILHHYNHVPCISGEQELTLSIKDVCSIGGILTNYIISQTMIIKLMHDIEHVKHTQYLSGLSVLGHLIDRDVFDVLSANKHEVESFIPALKRINSIIYSTNYLPQTVPA